ncbi:MAG: F0F1 ATP synthase subunit epsilon [Proteobacteria bacterium]|nr:F0F1 ATP synthase subunit epsilon [Pseudomonadota bacterium]
MADKIQLEVVTPERPVVSEAVDLVVATSTEGEFGVLPNHAPLLTTLTAGELRYRVGDKQESMAVLGGFAQVADNKVTILADAAEKAREIDLDRAQRARERAEKRLAAARLEEVDFIRAEVALKRALLRLKLARKASGS